MTRRTLRALVTFAASAAIAAALLAIPATSAAAHNSVVSTTPAEGSTIVEQPGTVSLTTNDALLDFGESTVVQVVGPDGRHFETACASVVEASAEVPTELGLAGTYTVVWQVVSTDGHPIAGEFAFDWQPAAGQPAGAGADEPACSSSGGDTDAVGPDGAASPVPADAASGNESNAAPIGDALWIAGGAIAVIAAGLVTWLVVRRRPAD